MHQRLLNFAVWLGIALCCTFLATALAFVRGAFAQDIQTAKGVVCDTKEQIEKFASLEATPDALNAINQEGKTNSCGFLAVAFIRGENVGETTIPQGRADIVEIVVVGVSTPQGWIRVAPSVQYVLFLKDERGA